MERRLFLTGMLGVAGAAALASLAGPGKAVAGIPAGNGILDELDKPDLLPEEAVLQGDDQAQVELVSHRHHHGHGHWRWRRRHGRRRGWRHVCRRYWHHGRWRRRCRRERYWINIWL
ncbi:protamine-2 (modular protein) [Mesorhizobium sp. GbtcB19]|uniref:protamine-2 (modular protein) n=1 Tax=Mesorhizobium sp. GbtcB19 TaxID=2824764 RepID=UPI001C2FB8F3|nr:protamine-2 (modular protein) [Mesorhizobium sp. GbtcB19]